MMMSIHNELLSIIEYKTIDDFTNYHNEHKLYNLSTNEDELFFQAIRFKKIDIADYIYNTKKNQELLCNIECLLFDVIFINELEIFKYLLAIKQKHEKKFSHDTYLINSAQHSNKITEYLLSLDNLYIVNYLLVYIHLIRIEDRKLILDFRNKYNSFLENNLINYSIFYPEEFKDCMINFLLKHKNIDYIKDEINYLILSSKNEIVKQEIINNIITNLLTHNEENIDMTIFKYMISTLDKSYLANYVGTYIISSMYQENIKIIDYLFKLNIYEKYSFIDNLEVKNRIDYKNNIEYVIFEFGKKIFDYFYDYLIDSIHTYPIFLNAIKYRKIYVLNQINIDKKIINITEIKKAILLYLYGTTNFSSKDDIKLVNKKIDFRNNNFKTISYLIEKYDLFMDDYLFIFKNMLFEFVHFNQENITYYLKFFENKKIPKKVINDINELMEFFVEKIILHKFAENCYELLKYLEEKLHFINFKKIDKLKKEIFHNNLHNINEAYFNTYIYNNLDKPDTKDITYKYIFGDNNLSNFYKLCYLENKNIELKDTNLIKEYFKNNISLNQLIFNTFDNEFINYLVKNQFIELKYNEIDVKDLYCILLNGDIDKIKICMLIPEINAKIIDYLENEQYNENCSTLFGDLLKKEKIDNLNFFVENKKDLKLKKFSTLIIKNIYNNNNFCLLKTNYYNLESKKNDKILESFLITIMKKCIINNNYEMFTWCLNKLEEKDKIKTNQQLPEICNNIIEKWFKYYEDIDTKIEIIHKMVKYFDNADKYVLTNSLIDKMMDNYYFNKLLDFKEIIIELFSSEEKNTLLNVIIEKTELNYIKFYINEIYKDTINFNDISIKHLLIGYSPDKLEYFRNIIQNFNTKINSELLYQVVSDINCTPRESIILIDLFNALYDIDNDYYKDKFDNTIFKLCCYFGNEDCLDFMLKVNKNINISDNNEEAFKNACDNGQLDIVKYLLKKNNHIDISNNNEEAMFNACSSGHLNVAKFLYKIKPSINLSIKEDFLFSEACNNGNLSVVKWLYSILGEKICAVARYEHSICGACFYGHLNTAKWLYNTFGDIDITVDNDYCFINACKNEYIDICYWIMELLPDRYSLTYNVDEDTIESYNINKVLVITETKQHDTKDECFICVENESNVISSCNHQYCFTCIEKLYKMSTSLSCPYCRTEKITLFNMI